MDHHVQQPLGLRLELLFSHIFHLEICCFSTQHHRVLTTVLTIPRPTPNATAPAGFLQLFHNSVKPLSQTKKPSGREGHGMEDLFSVHSFADMVPGRRSAPPDNPCWCSTPKRSSDTVQRYNTVFRSLFLNSRFGRCRSAPAS